MKCATTISVLLGLSLLAGCKSITGLTAGASMRVDVEVYTGPLSKTSAIQWFELRQLIVTVNQAFIDLEKTLRSTRSNVCTGQSEEHEVACVLLAAMQADAGELKKEAQQLTASVTSAQTTSIGRNRSRDKTEQLHIEKLLKESAAFAIRLKSKSLYWSEANASNTAIPVRVRAVTARLPRSTAKYGVLLASRTDALYRQEIHGISREKLVLGMSQGDASPTGFINTYDWSRVNTVHTSGMGNVSVALIKDDIGNWDLKTFNLDPVDPLEASVRNVYSSLKTHADPTPNTTTGRSARTRDTTFKSSVINQRLINDLRILQDEAASHEAAHSADLLELDTELARLSSTAAIRSAAAELSKARGSSSDQSRSLKSVKEQGLAAFVAARSASPSISELISLEGFNSNALETASNHRQTAETEARTAAEATEANLAEARLALEKANAHNLAVSALLDQARKEAERADKVAAQKTFRESVITRVEKRLADQMVLIGALQEASLPSTSKRGNTVPPFDGSLHTSPDGYPAGIPEIN